LGKLGAFDCTVVVDRQQQKEGTCKDMGGAVNHRIASPLRAVMFRSLKGITQSPDSWNYALL
jgi:hypothetical protein